MSPLEQIRALYFNATQGSIRKDLPRAIELFKRLGSEEEREKSAVFMDGLSQMRSEWTSPPSAQGKSTRSRG